MAAPVFLLPVVNELRWLAHPPFSPSDEFALWLITTFLSVALLIGFLAAAMWLIRLRPPEKS